MKKENNNTSELKIKNWKVRDKTNGMYLTVEFKNTDSVHSFYEYCREQAVLTCFGGNEYENKSYIHLLINGELYCVSSPRAWCGDNQWYSYPGKKYAIITKIPDDEMSDY